MVRTGFEAPLGIYIDTYYKETFGIASRLAAEIGSCSTITGKDIFPAENGHGALPRTTRSSLRNCQVISKLACSVLKRTHSCLGQHDLILPSTLSGFKIVFNPVMRFLELADYGEKSRCIFYLWR